MTFLIFAFILGGLIARNLHFAAVFFYDWDEAMYAQIASEVLKNKSLLTTFNGQLWLDKPPLSHFLIALVFKIFGPSQFWSRFLMLIIAFIAIILTYYLNKKTINLFFKNQLKKNSSFENQIIYLLPILVLISSSLFLERTTMLNTDIMVGVGWLGYFLFKENFWLKLLFLTIGVYSKSILGFYPLFLEGITLKREDFRIRNLIYFTLLIILPSAWYIYGLLKVGNNFIQVHFLDQVIKRLFVPIELHFGDKFYYPAYLWNSLGILSLLIIIGYGLIVIDFVRLFKKKGFGFMGSKELWSYLTLFSPLLFMVVLTFGKTKIYWYLATMLPLFTLVYSYLYLKIESIYIRIIIVILITGYFIINFIPNTYLLKDSYKAPEKVKLAQCLSKNPNETLAFLVDEEERKIKNFLEAAHYQTGSSFFYGGSPSFVFYVKKRINFFYSIDKLSHDISKYNLIVISKQDWQNNNQLKEILELRYSKLCSSANWLSFVK